jgi:hypothetical protein
VFAFNPHLVFCAGIHHRIDAAESAANVFGCIDKIFLDSTARRQKDKVMFVWSEVSSQIGSEWGTSCSLKGSSHICGDEHWFRLTLALSAYIVGQNLSQEDYCESKQLEEVLNLWVTVVLWFCVSRSLLHI